MADTDDTTEDFEPSVELDALRELSEDADKQFARIKTLHSKGKLRTNEELVGTVLPLISDLFGALLNWGKAQEEILDDIADELEDDGPSMPFDTEDLQVMHDALLMSIANMKAILAHDTTPAELREMAKSKLPSFERVARLLEEVLSGEAEAEGDDGDEDEEEAEDGDSEVAAADGDEGTET